MANFVTPDKTASRRFEPGGVYIGTVTRVDESINRVWVTIPRFITGAEFGPLAVVGPELPVVNDRVACLFVEKRTDNIVVIGVIKNQSTLPTSFVMVATSSTRPVSPRVGTIVYETDTEDIYVWSGTEWLSFFEVNLPATIYADLQGTAASATVALSVADNSVVLGGDTTGDYVSTITAGTNMSVTTGTGEGSTPTLATSTTPSFSTITSTVATGTAPLTVASTTLITNLNADRLDGEHGSWYSPSGLISPYAGLTAPAGWLFCDGSSVSRTTYATLFSTLTATVGTCTITTASPAVVSLTAHGLVEGDAIYFTTTGALPTGLTANITYYVKYVGVNSFQVSLTRTSAAAVNSGPSIAAGTAVNTTVAGSGTHTVVKAPHGVSSASTFLVPDFRGQVPVGIDNIGGTDAGVMGISNALGAKAGEVKHTLDKTELPDHTHGAGTLANSLDTTHTHTAGKYDALGINNNGVAAGADYQALVASGASATTRVLTNGGTSHGHTISGLTGTGEGLGYAHNVMQPFVLVNYIIKT